MNGVSGFITAYGVMIMMIKVDTLRRVKSLVDRKKAFASVDDADDDGMFTSRFNIGRRPLSVMCGLRPRAALSIKNKQSIQNGYVNSQVVDF
ncbi:hypothetical protein Clacol_000898 [Clathrus columnatus]|uniref:Uncharacterized protein n=1 Tax=Clathrus columnatus TaxID=1419009 RepID=A0AAV5A249_9AGAM|nr:hypothetical protein Clacol_000898 [Clathrus columnatus]